MLDNTTKRRIDTARDILVGKVPDPKSQVEQITIALIYKFMDDMDIEAEELGGSRSFFQGDYRKYAWSNIFDPRMGGFEILELYSEAILKMNTNPNIPQLFRDIFKNAYLPYRDPETLKSFLKIINEFEYDHSERLGDAFEYLLSVLGSQGDAGQFRTPRHIIDFMVEIIDPQKQETILDPACGTAGFLISSYKHILKHNSANYKPEEDRKIFEEKGISLTELTLNGKKYKGDLLTPNQRNQLSQNIRGYDISPDMVRLSLVNMYLHGLHDPHINEYDTLTSEDKWNEFSDVILANPPFMSPKGGIRPHKRFSIPSNRSEVLFVNYMAEHLTPTGKCAVIVPEGIIFQSGTAYKSLRKMLVENYLVGVISLPAGVFQPYSGVKTSILWLDKTLAKKAEKILFIKVENDGFVLGAQRKPIKLNDLPQAAKSIAAYKKSLQAKEVFDVAGISNVSLVEKAKIGESGEYNLSGERYKSTQNLSSVTYDIVSIGEVFTTSSGGTPLKKIDEYYKNGTIPWLRSGEVAKGYIYSAEILISDEALKNSSAKIFPVNTVLVAMYGATAGQVGILKFESATNQAICGILPNEKAIPEYIYLIVKSQKEYLISLSGGGAQPNISQKIVRDLKIPLPPLSVQEEIVAEIEGYQKIIDGARQVVENYKPRIEIDQEWDVVELGTIYENLDGKRIPITKSDRNEGIYPYYGASGIVDYVANYLFDENLLLVSEDGANLLARSTPIAFSVSGKIWVNNHAHVLRFKEISTQMYIEVYLNSIPLNNYITGAAQPKLNQKALNSIPIPLPDIEVQHKIVSRIEKEQELVNANKQLIEIYEQKIKGRIARVWGE